MVSHLYFNLLIKVCINISLTYYFLLLSILATVFFISILNSNVSKTVFIHLSILVIHLLLINVFLSLNYPTSSPYLSFFYGPVERDIFFIYTKKTTLKIIGMVYYTFTHRFYMPISSV